MRESLSGSQSNHCRIPLAKAVEKVLNFVA
jgi:hypothetical protein